MDCKGAQHIRVPDWYRQNGAMHPSNTTILSVLYNENQLDAVIYHAQDSDRWRQAMDWLDRWWDRSTQDVKVEDLYELHKLLTEGLHRQWKQSPRMEPTFRDTEVSMVYKEDAAHLFGEQQRWKHYWTMAEWDQWQGVLARLREFGQKYPHLKAQGFNAYLRQPNIGFKAISDAEWATMRKIAYFPPDINRHEIQEALAKMWTDALKMLERKDTKTQQQRAVSAAAFVHQQITFIHPFLFGNGRLARVCASLILVQHGLWPFLGLPEREYMKVVHKSDTDLVKLERFIQDQQFELTCWHWLAYAIDTARAFVLDW